MNKAVARRVVKLGGSLLEFAELVPRLRAWLSAQAPAENLLVIGGGRAADAIREADRLHQLDEPAAHWLCVRAMALNAELVAALLPEARLSRSVPELIADTPQERLLIVEPWRFLRDDEPRLAATPLPESWDVTSDSVAARLATIVGAEELVLLKSALPEPPHTIEAAAKCGYVDAWFPRAAGALKQVRCMNLRDERMVNATLAATTSGD
jgi:aspartokinase-like uncharacterized kinase